MIAPHGDLAIAEACTEDARGLARATQRAMDEMGRRVAAASPDTIVVCTPHGVHVSGRLAVVTASRAAGALDEAATPVAVSCSVDRELALACARAIAAAGVPVVEVSYGGNDPDGAVMPLDWGGLVPLWHIQRHAPALPVVIVSPARELSAQAHVDAGAALLHAAAGLGRRVALVASADQGHGHSASGPYGLHVESAAFDERVTALVRAGDLDELLAISATEVHAAVADSWWQMLMLLGAVRAAGGVRRTEVLAYEAPTYYGMLTAVVDAGSG